jgi:hypothetical protein
MFHVPEPARDRLHARLHSTNADGCNGIFRLSSPEPGWMLACMVSDGERWEHVSVHAYRDARRKTTTRVPNWREMCFVKDVFWEDEDVVMQLHPRRSQYVNAHPHVLHLWRPTAATIPEPPAVLVGPVGDAPPTAAQIDAYIEDLRK